MNSLISKSRIKLFLSRFETLVRISSANNEFDINKHSENFLIPFLKLLYGWDLTNANIQDKNSTSIDLIDTKKRIAIQVTSNTSLEKIKDTFFKFFQSKYKNRVSKVYFYFLVPKQKTYSEKAISNIIKQRIKFDQKSHLLDNSDIYRYVSNLTEIKHLKEIERYLNNEFSEFILKDEVKISDFENFKSKYKESCLSNFTRLNFFGLSITQKPREVELYQLFVQPNFTLPKKRIFISTNTIMKFTNKLFQAKQIKPKSYKRKTKSKKSSKLVIATDSTEIFYDSTKSYFEKSLKNELSLVELFNMGPHVVLLGNPGAGKSSLVKYAICKIIEGDTQLFEELEIYNYLPYRIELHRYNQFKKQNKGGFLDFIKENLIDEFQINTKNAIVTKIIEKFPSLIFFDGLDEIFDIQDRIQVRNDIENFIRQYPLVRSVVTCRFESYEEVKFNDELYVVLNVNDFNDKQIKEYVEKWYNIEEDNENVRKQEIKDCLQQLKGVDDQLKHNPLLLSLILILYRNEQELPTSKLDIYEGCAHTIIETRDKKEKKLNLNLRVSHKISVFSNLAFWQFNNEIINKIAKIDYFSIETFITKYLLNKGEFEENEDARDAARQFLEYAKLRSIYFENKFTHKTFYEYFTAYYIFSNYYSTPGEYSKFQELLLENIGLSSWAVILELLICKIDKSQIEYKVIDNIIDSLLIKKAPATCILFANVLPHLRAISPMKTKNLIYTMVKCIISSNIDIEQKYTLAEKLLDLIKVKKFLECYCTIIENELKSKVSEYLPLIFDLTVELYGITYHAALLKLLSDHHRINKDESKLFIISSIIPGISKMQFLQRFKEFCQKFGKKAAMKTYESNYRYPIFRHLFSFNWLASVLLNTETKSEVSILEKFLVDLDFNVDDLSKIVKLSKWEQLSDVVAITRRKNVYENSTLLRNLFTEWQM